MSGAKVGSEGPTASDAREAEWADDAETETASLGEPTRPADQGGVFLLLHMGERVSFLDLRDPGEWIIGRASDAGIVVDDRQVSRHHATLSLRAGELTITDAGSRNGTLLNGRTLRRETARLATGDTLEIGTCQAVVALRSPRAGTPPSQADGDSSDVVIVDPEMARLYAMARKAAPMPTTVLILGETGSGKDVLARRIHGWSTRASKPFVRINCAGIPESLLESELFGHERGAFTGADRRKAGYFEAANGGTVFLDEIGELSPGAQVKLLNVLENHTVTRLGGTTPIPIDVRIVCATHRDLEAFVAEERFRADLYYRISPFKLRIPPLRERATEIELLATVFVQQLASRVGRPPPPIAPDVLAVLVKHRWPGNVRELRNAVEHAFVMAEGGTLRAEHLASELRMPAAPVAEAGAAGASSGEVRKRVAEMERRTIEEALAAEGGNQTRAAARLGLPRRTLVYKLTRYRREDGDDGKK